MTSLQDILKGLNPDAPTSALYGRPIYSIFDVDNRLHELFGDYEPTSMHDLILEKCGAKVLKQVEHHLGL